MPRTKKKLAAVENQLSQDIRAESRAQNEHPSPKEVTPSEGSAPHMPNPPLPKSPFDSIKEDLRAARSRRIVIEGEPLPLPYDDIKKTYREIWQRIGFFSNHPNHDHTAINEAYIKSMMGRSHKLGKVIHKYRLFINKPTGKRAMLIQYPNRVIGQEYRAASGNKPLEIRIKPRCGLVEVDIPVDIHVNFNQTKGVEYGEAMRKSRFLQEGGSYTLSGGLGIGPKGNLRRDLRVGPQWPPFEGPSPEKLLENFDDANNKGHVMNKITLGGQIYPFKSGDPIYMAATFTKGEQVRTDPRSPQVLSLNHSQTFALGRKWMQLSNYGPSSATLMLSTRLRRPCFEPSVVRIIAITLKYPKLGLLIWLLSRPNQARRTCTEE